MSAGPPMRIRQRARLAIATWAACVLLACSGAPAALDRAGSDRNRLEQARDSSPATQDRLPGLPAPPVVPTTPFANALRQRVVVSETLTGDGKPVEIGSIEVPQGWPAAPVAHGPTWQAWARCVLWSAVSPDGRSRIVLLSPWRSHEASVPAGPGLAQGRLAAKLLRDDAGAMAGAEVVAESGPLPALTPATRRGWQAGGAWLSSLHADPVAGMRHRFMSVEVESAPGSQRFRRAQSGPMLLVEVAAEDFDAAAAEAIRRSLRLHREWLPRWWLAWELRTVRQTCEGGLNSDGLCVRRPSPYVDYFTSADALGLWDLRAGSPYAPPDAGIYDR